tara:strand:+ start:438 stop:671 length:234 start_codon:yes stop_codon:yes gene_type:complete
VVSDVHLLGWKNVLVASPAIGIITIEPLTNKQMFLVLADALHIRRMLVAVEAIMITLLFLYGVWLAVAQERRAVVML